MKRFLVSRKGPGRRIPISHPQIPGRSRSRIGRREATVLKAEQIGEEYFLLEVSDPKGPLPDSGQFYMLSTVKDWGSSPDSPGRPFLPRPMSAWSEEQGILKFLLLSTGGPGSTRLTELDANDHLYLTGPLGRGFTQPRDEPGNATAILVAGGVGVPPIAALDRELVQAGVEHVVLLGFRTESQARAMQSVGAFPSDPMLAVEEKCPGADIEGRVTGLLERNLADMASVSTVFACGPSPMLEAVRRICSERDVFAQLALETTMACGYGACFGCTVETDKGYIRLCVDGPVVDSNTLERVQ